MKTWLCLLLVFAFIQEKGFSQSTLLEKKVLVEVPEGTIGFLLDEISREGGFIFSYGQDIPHNDQVTLGKSFQSVRQHLEDMFHGSIHCVEIGNKLMIKEKPRQPEIYTISGRVQDAITGEALVGVHISIPETDSLIGSVSDATGHFKIDVPTGMDMIRFSCMGYESISLPTGESGRKPVSLEPGMYTIEELVYEYYVKPVQGSLNLPVSYIPSTMIETIPVSTIDHMLQGASPGIQVSRNSGMPGASLQVRIRGIHSLINSEPVYYLDGVPVQQAIIPALSPHDIASIEILKDASATSMYGSSAGNGVVLLNSRKGTSDQINASLHYQWGLHEVARTADLMSRDEYLAYFHEVRPYDARFDNLEDLYDTDWQKLTFHKGHTQDIHFSVNGGTKKSVFYFSTGYHQQTSTIKDLDLQRYSMMTNATHAIGAKWKIGHQVSFSHMSYTGLKEGAFLNDFNNPILASMCMLPLVPPSDSTPVMLSDRVDLSSSGDYAELDHNQRKNYALLGNLHSSLILLPGLTFETSFGLEVLYQDNVSYSRHKPHEKCNRYNPVIGDEYQIMDLAFQVQNQLRYDIDLQGGHAFATTGGFEYIHGNNAWIPLSRTLYDEYMNHIEEPANLLISDAVPEKWDRDFTMKSISASISYAFRNKYSLNLGFRRDVVGYYRFRELENLTGIFPSFSVGWVFTKENFLAQNRILQYGKFRYAWGKAGNSPRMNYSFYSKMMRDMEYVCAFNSTGTITRSATFRRTNERFYWESTATHSLGMDLGFFDNRLFISLDYFQSQLHKGQCKPVDVALHYVGELYQRDVYGFGYLPAASIKNKGMEWSVEYRKSGRLLNWNLNLHMTHLHSRITDVEEGSMAELEIDLYDPISVNFRDHPAGSFFGYKIERLYREEDLDHPALWEAQPKAEPGDYMFRDLNQDGEISQEDRTILGYPFPDFTFGLYTDVAFQGFDLSILLQGVYGNEIFNATKLWLYNPYGLSNWTSDIVNSYQSPEFDETGTMTKPGNTDTDLHRFDLYAKNKNLRPSDFYIEDGSYLRIKNIQLGYTLRSELSRKIHMKKIRVFLCAQNLYTFTRYSGLDPEVGGWGIDCGIYPQPRTYMAGVNVEF